MKYTIDDAKDRLGLSYAKVYSDIKDLNLGRREGSRIYLDDSDVSVLFEYREQKRKRRSRVYRLEEEIDSLKAEMSRLDFVLESLERRLDEKR